MNVKGPEHVIRTITTIQTLRHLSPLIILNRYKLRQAYTIKYTHIYLEILTVILLDQMNHRNEVNYNYNDEVNYNYNDLNFPQDNGTETGSNYNSTLNALSDPEVQILEKLMQ